MARVFFSLKVFASRLAGVPFWTLMVTQKHMFHFPIVPPPGQDASVAAHVPDVPARCAVIEPLGGRQSRAIAVFAVRDAKRQRHGAVLLLADLSPPGASPPTEPEWLLADDADLSRVKGTRGAGAGSWTCDNAGCNACWLQAAVPLRCPRCAGEAAADVAATSLARDQARTGATALDHSLSRVRTCELALRSRPFGEEVLQLVAGEYASPDPAPLRATAATLGLLQTAERSEQKHDGVRRNLSSWIAASTLGIADLHNQAESCNAELVAAAIGLLPQQYVDRDTGQRRCIVALRAADVTALREHGVPFPTATVLRREVMRAMRSRAASERPPAAVEPEPDRPAPVEVENTFLSLQQAVDAARHACLGAPPARAACPTQCTPRLCVGPSHS